MLKIIYNFVLMVFKQKSAFVLCAIYAFSIIGIALSMHFCGGKLADVALYANKTSCEYCKAEPVDKADDGCCTNTKVEAKIKDDHQSQASFKLPKLFSLETYLPRSVSEIFKTFTPRLFSQLENKAPPPVSGVSLRVLYCVFRN